MRRAVYAGSFDPVTLGYLWMIDRGRALFDELIGAGESAIAGAVGIRDW